MIFALFRRRSERRLVDRLHGEIVAAVRQPALYENCGVPDTLEGRFEMLVLHACLIMRRLKGLDRASQDLGQKLTDSVFRHLDIALRETGVSDIGVPKRMKKLASSYLGRAAAYGAALDEGNREALAQALSRNVFAGARAPASPEVERLARYAVALDLALSQTPASSFLAGTISLPAASKIVGAES